jgi:hypothetical protein
MMEHLVPVFHTTSIPIDGSSKPPLLIRSPQPQIACLGQFQNTPGMSVLHLLGFSALHQLLQGVLADRLEHSVACRLTHLHPGHHKRFIHQSAQNVQHVFLLDSISRAHRLGRL